MEIEDDEEEEEGEDYLDKLGTAALEDFELTQRQQQQEQESPPEAAGGQGHGHNEPQESAGDPCPPVGSSDGTHAARTHPHPHHPTSFLHQPLPPPPSSLTAASAPREASVAAAVVGSAHKWHNPYAMALSSTSSSSSPLESASSSLSSRVVVGTDSPLRVVTAAATGRTPLGGGHHYRHGHGPSGGVAAEIQAAPPLAQTPLNGSSSDYGSLLEKLYARDGELKFLQSEKEILVEEMKKKDEHIRSLHAQLVEEKQAMVEQFLKEKESAVTDLRFKEQELVAMQEKCKALEKKPSLHQLNSASSVSSKLHLPPLIPQVRPKVTEFLSTENFIPLSQVRKASAADRDLPTVSVQQHQKKALSDHEQGNPSYSLGENKPPSSAITDTCSSSPIKGRDPSAETPKSTRVAVAFSEEERSQLDHLCKPVLLDARSSEPTGTQLLMLLADNDLLTVPSFASIDEEEQVASQERDKEGNKSWREAAVDTSDAANADCCDQPKKLTGLLSLLHLSSSSSNSLYHRGGEGVVAMTTAHAQATPRCHAPLQPDHLRPAHKLKQLSELRTPPPPPRPPHPPLHPTPTQHHHPHNKHYYHQHHQHQSLLRQALTSSAKGSTAPPPMSKSARVLSRTSSRLPPPAFSTPLRPTALDQEDCMTLLSMTSLDPIASSVDPHLLEQKVILLLRDADKVMVPPPPSSSSSSFSFFSSLPSSVTNISSGGVGSKSSSWSLSPLTTPLNKNNNSCPLESVASSNGAAFLPQVQEIIVGYYETYLEKVRALHELSVGGGGGGRGGGGGGIPELTGCGAANTATSTSASLTAAVSVAATATAFSCGTAASGSSSSFGGTDSWGYNNNNNSFSTISTASSSSAACSSRASQESVARSHSQLELLLQALTTLDVLTVYSGRAREEVLSQPPEFNIDSRPSSSMDFTSTATTASSSSGGGGEGGGGVVCDGGGDGEVEGSSSALAEGTGVGAKPPLPEPEGKMELEKENVRDLVMYH